MSDTRGTTTFLVFLCLALCYRLTFQAEPEPFPKEFDFRYISYEDLVKSSEIFRNENIIGFTQLTLDEQNDQVIVGARNRIFRLSVDNLTVLQSVDVSATPEQTELCTMRGQPEENCNNFIRVLLLHNYTKTDSLSDVKHAIYVCGTNAFSPNCEWRSATDVAHLIESESGVGKTPWNPDHNSTAIITEDGDFYGATMVGPDRDPAIYRSRGPKTGELRTLQSDIKWLNEPDFVSAYEIGKYVYFMFREVATEYINCGKRIYSRVARVCKTDAGAGDMFFGTSFTTYLKARLNCSQPGQYPFYYDEIQSTFYLEDEMDKFIYAVFTTPLNSIAGSAVCVYKVKTINETFYGPYKYQESPRAAWEKHDNPKPVECPEKKDLTKRDNNDAKKSMIETNYQLMDDAIQPITMTPFLHASNERWTHIVVDNVHGKNGHYKVVFVATADGKLRKMTQIPTTNETCLIEEIKIVPNGEFKPVKAMEISSKDMAVFVSTHEHVIRIPVERCSRFKNGDLCVNSNDPYCGWNEVESACTTAPSGQPEVYFCLCVNSNDPYCGWNEVESACTTAPSGQPEVHFWYQSMASCPFVQHPVDGGWTDWSGWDTCTQVGGGPATGDCLCRSRSCSDPKPLYGGAKCEGPNVEVTNCTAHGQWTEWAEWSSCSQTCGSTAIRRRQRYCSNPPPRFGGRDCMGIDSEEEYCQGHPPCPLPPVQGDWIQWADWSDCSAECNGGIQTRRRSCQEPQGSVDVIPCNGNTQEWRMCNTQICDELTQMTPWTPWQVINRTRGGYFEERFRFMCRAKVPSQSMIRAKHSKTQSRFCFDGGECHTSGFPVLYNVDGGWSIWTEWTTCTRDCGGGNSWRARECNNPAPMGNGADCYGHMKEGRECNSHSCQGTWSCWAESTSCSVTCGHGVIVRTRQCQTDPPGFTYTIPCEGEPADSVDCYRGPCIALAAAASYGEDNNDFMEKALAAAASYGEDNNDFMERALAAAASYGEDNNDFMEKALAAAASYGEDNNDFMERALAAAASYGEDNNDFMEKALAAAASYGEDNNDFMERALAAAASYGEDNHDFMERGRFSLAQMFLVGGLSFILGGLASLALFAYIQSFRKAMTTAKEEEKVAKIQKELKKQQEMARRTSKVSVKPMPSLSSQVSLDNIVYGRSKFYDIEGMMRESVYNSDQAFSTLDKNCKLKTFTVKDL